MRAGSRRFIITALAVPVLLYCVLVVSPYLQSFYISLTDWNGLSPERNFVGLANYARLLDDEVFWISLWHNVIAVVVIPVATLALGLFFATMIRVGRYRARGGATGVRGAAFYRIAYFFPHVLSIAVIGVLFSNVYDPTASGLANGLLGVVGIDPVNWLGDKQTAYPAILAVIVWLSVGFYVVLFMGAMSSIPTEIYEAARLDGASRWQIFHRVTLPLIWDTVQVAGVYLGIHALDMFAIVNVMSAAGGSGGPDNATQVLGNHLYLTAFQDSRFGYATAIGVALLLLTLVFAWVSLKVTRRDRIEY
ncbi:carbohydrate ABC transporter permease [Nonomuraea soli]|uniref:N-acetylglucosamine transport system permease protein n=1 Tax=Nonomuraea soli TaxID=1032476 RepID=A0A7W0CRU7_9ACTN|nr:sugar ABC transporter permease [Nonomuraea soli]MBA2896115.1 N-acetylglucosamine transport system permease protein [Nonomuraea soli]